MGLIDVVAKKGDKSATVQYDFGDDLASAVKMTSEEVVFSNYVQSAKITLQAGMRRCLENNKDASEFAGSFVPGVQTARAAVDPVAAMKSKFANMDADERKAFLGELKGIK